MTRGSQIGWALISLASSAAGQAGGAGRSNPESGARTGTRHQDPSTALMTSWAGARVLRLRLIYGIEPADPVAPYLRELGLDNSWYLRRQLWRFGQCRSNGITYAVQDVSDDLRRTASRQPPVCRLIQETISGHSARALHRVDTQAVSGFLDNVTMSVFPDSESGSSRPSSGLRTTGGTGSCGTCRRDRVTRYRGHASYIRKR